MPETGQTDLEAMERRSPAQSGGDQDELLQAAGGAGDGQDVRASGGGAAHPCGAAQPLQPAGPSCDGRCGVNPSGVWGMASQIWFMQQRHFNGESVVLRRGTHGFRVEITVNLASIFICKQSAKDPFF